MITELLLTKSKIHSIRRTEHNNLKKQNPILDLTYSIHYTTETKENLCIADYLKVSQVH